MPQYTLLINARFNNQVGVGLMVFQQFGGVNAVFFYASAIFVSAGK